MPLHCAIIIFVKSNRTNIQPKTDSLISILIITNIHFIDDCFGPTLIRYIIQKSDCRKYFGIRPLLLSRVAPEGGRGGYSLSVEEFSLINTLIYCTNYENLLLT